MKNYTLHTTCNKGSHSWSAFTCEDDWTAVEKAKQLIDRISIEDFKHIILHDASLGRVLIAIARH